MGAAVPTARGVPLSSRMFGKRRVTASGQLAAGLGILTRGLKFCLLPSPGPLCFLQVPQVSVVDGVFVFWSNRTCECSRIPFECACSEAPLACGPPPLARSCRRAAQ